MSTDKLSLKTLDPLLREAVDAVLAKKGAEVLVLDLRDVASFTDFFILCTGQSNRQLRSIADGVEESLRLLGRKPTHVEGYPNGGWILVDYVDFIVHIFNPLSRSYYELERLWGDADRLAIAI